MKEQVLEKAYNEYLDLKREQSVGNQKVFLESGIDRISKTIFINEMVLLILFAY